VTVCDNSGTVPDRGDAEHQDHRTRGSIKHPIHAWPQFRCRTASIPSPSADGELLVQDGLILVAPSPYWTVSFIRLPRSLRTLICAPLMMFHTPQIRFIAASIIGSRPAGAQPALGQSTSTDNRSRLPTNVLMAV